MIYVYLVLMNENILVCLDDLKAVTKRLIAQAKRQGSADNISIIVVFLKDPRDIAADNRPPMDLG
jgi:serine/threonine protein phosphatase PrpC